MSDVVPAETSHETQHCMRARRAPRRCPGRSCSFQILLGGVIVAGALFLLLREHLGGSERRQRSREERLVKQLREDLTDFELYLTTVGQISTPVLQPSTQKRRGIVICAGGPTLLANVYVSVKVLRDTLNSTLPIEIYHNGVKEADPQTKAAFAEFSRLKFIDLSTLPLPQHHVKPQLFNGYVQKIFSLYSTSFEQVLMLDADSQPVKDPALLFESATFKRTGNLFWSDFWKEGYEESPEEIVYRWLGLTPPWTYKPGWRCAESGQFLFDRTQHADVLEWVWHLNTHAKLLYEHMLGDKDTFEMAFILADKEAFYSRVLHGPGLPVSKLQDNIQHDEFSRRHFTKEERRRYLRLGMLQFDDSADAAFLHRTERTKFAQKKKGYSLDVMHPEFFVPPLSTNVTSQIRWLVWRMHSIPESLADIDCDCCGLDASAAAVVRAAGLPVSARNIKTTNSSCTATAEGVPKLPLYPFAALGPRVQAASAASFDAYRELQRKLPSGRLPGSSRRLTVS